jgi:hypothetical protein
MDHEKRHLFTVGENVREERQEMWHNFMHPTVAGGPGAHVSWGGSTFPAVSYWAFDDLQGNVRGGLKLQIERGGSVTTLADASGTPQLVVNVTRGMTSMTATATGPDGRPILEARGNLFHHTFSIHDSTGIEVAKIHEAFASLRDTYHLELMGNVDPVAAIVFAILIDHYKGK